MIARILLTLALTMPMYGAQAQDSGSAELRRVPLAAIERTEALGDGAYTVAGPIPNPRDPIPIALGFIRLINAAATDSVMEIQVVGLQSGANYGAVAYSLLAHSAPQLSTAAVLNDAGIGAPVPPDLGFTYLLKASNPRMGFALINFNPLNFAFENTTHCTYLPGVDYSWTNSVVLNVHTTVFGQFPSIINLYNAYSHAVSYRYDVYDAALGSFVGSTTQVVQPNTTFPMNNNVLQSRIGVANSTLLYLNVFITPETPASDIVTVNHYVFFTGSPTRTPTLVAMTNFCPVTQ